MLLRFLAALGFASLFALGGCQGQQTSYVVPTPTLPVTQSVSSSTPPGTERIITHSEAPLAPEVNPAGDIPDTQAFVPYVSTSGGYALDAPEGWAQTERGPDVHFSDKLGGLVVQIMPATSAPTAASARVAQAKQIEKTGRAVQIRAVKDLSLPAGSAVEISYGSNSDLNSVTNKQVRLDNVTYLFFKGGKVAALTLSAPQGADNIDQWTRMSRSFHWL